MLRVIVLSAAFLIGSLPVAAGVTIDGDEPGREVTVTMENASVDAVLKELHEKYGFDVEGLKHATAGEVLNATLSGSLSDVITRLLRNWNHVIVRSDQAPTGIRKVVIIDAAYGTTASKTKQEKAAIQQLENTKKATGED